jgi:hypothetical protein
MILQLAVDVYVDLHEWKAHYGLDTVKAAEEDVRKELISAAVRRKLNRAQVFGQLVDIQDVTVNYGITNEHETKQIAREVLDSRADSKEEDAHAADL